MERGFIRTSRSKGEVRSNSNRATQQQRRTQQCHVYLDGLIADAVNLMKLVSSILLAVESKEQTQTRSIVETYNATLADNHMRILHLV